MDCLRVEGIPCAVAEVWCERDERVCLLGARLGVLVMSRAMEFTLRSSLLSNCTSGLVGCLYMKLDESDEDNEGGDDLYVLERSGNGVLMSKLKFRGGEVANQGDELSELNISACGIALVLSWAVGVEYRLDDAS